MDESNPISESNPPANATAGMKTSPESHDELKNSLSLVRATLESTMDGILIVDRNNHIVDCNQKFVSMWRIPKEMIESGDEMQALGHVLSQVADPAGLQKIVTKLYDNIEEAGELGEILFKDGRVFERYSQPQRVGNEIVGRVWSFRDITQRKQTEESLRLQERAIAFSPHGIIICDITKPHSPISYVNPAFERITGYKSDEVIGQNCRFLQGADRDQYGVRRINLALQHLHEESVVIRNYRKDGSLFWNQLNIAPVFEPSGKVTHYVGILMDITNQKTLEEQLLHQATHDSLTTLPNRSLLLDRIQQAIIHARRSKLLVAILFLDLDQFKTINDGLGHMIGDELLKTVAQRLSLRISESDTIARMGGDEFVIVFPNVEKEETIYEEAQKILTELAKPIFIEEKELHITTSIGISFYPHDGDDVNTLLKNADMSMYLAKENGRNNFQTYTAELDRKLTQRMTLENHLRSALERREFIVYYQPLMNLRNDRICGMEALIRWMHPELGLISPQDFIPIVEEDGLIIPIGKWVMEIACQQLKDWHQQGFTDLCMSVNLSGRQLQQPDIIDIVRQTLETTNLDPEHLELEITETTLLENTEETIDKLHQLKEVGIHLSIDDFGTGYSSLNYLKRFPVDKLKIDRSFVQDLTSNQNNASITIAIINLASSLQLTVLAEGIETEAQLTFLKENNCDQGQGYYFSKPVPADEFLVLLKKYNSVPADLAH
jgi:diguanylate cyclase (GGDEF)-like protein/PAS domain S-box-containing protein